MKSIFSVLGFCLALSSLSSAAITASGDFKTGATQPTLTITTPITYTATKAGNVRFIVLDDWVTSDGTFNDAFATAGSSVSYQINGGTLQTVSLGFLNDNFGTQIGGVNHDDGFLVFDSIVVATGDVVTVLPQTFTFTSSPLFNQPPASFTGNTFLLDDTFGIVSDVAPVNGVPEPSTAILGALGALGLLRRRR